MIGAKRIYYLSNKKTLSETETSFTCALPIPSGENYDHVTVLQANIPISYYLVRNGFNSFDLYEPGANVTITIPQGSYNVNTFATTLKGLLNSLSPNGFEYNLTTPITNGAITGKYTYTVNNPLGNLSDGDVKFVFGHMSHICEQMGFDTDTTVTFVAGTLTSMYVVNFVAEQTLFIHSDICSNGDDDILQEIYQSNSSGFSTITYLATDPISYSKKLKSRSTQTITLSLTDEHNFPLDLNGGVFLITIMLFKYNDLYKLTSTFLKYKLSLEEA